MKLLIAALFLAALPLQSYVLADATALAGGLSPIDLPSPDLPTGPPSTNPPTNLPAPAGPTAPCSYCYTTVSPVCGNNGRTYRNQCFLQCESLLNQANGKPPIYLSYYGPCFFENCGCSNLYNPRCASDGKTYGNKCLFDCQNQRRYALGLSPLTVKYIGACIKCPCSNAVNPVCASDQKTYKNPCFLKCENDIRKASGLPPLKILYNGICTCICKNYYDPVCGTDDRDYKNICLLQCESDKRVALGLSPITLAYGGPCTCDCSMCPKPSSPVCGDDGRTYWNSCWLQRYSACNIARKQPKITQVKTGYC